MGYQVFNKIDGCFANLLMETQSELDEIMVERDGGNKKGDSINSVSRANRVVIRLIERLSQFIQSRDDNPCEEIDDSGKWTTGQILSVAFIFGTSISVGLAASLKFCRLLSSKFDKIFGPSVDQQFQQVDTDFIIENRCPHCDTESTIAQPVANGSSFSQHESSPTSSGGPIENDFDADESPIHFHAMNK